MSYRITKINIHLIVCFNCIILCDYSQFLNNLGDNIVRTKCCCSTTVRTAALCSIFICQSFCYTRLVIAIRKHIYTLPAIIPHPTANYSAVSGFPANPAYTLPHVHRIGHYDVSLSDGSAREVLHIPNTQAVSAPVGH